MSAFVLTIAEWGYAIILSVVQGLTEFVPISSSGQLSILNMFFDGDPQAAMDFYFFLHIPTTIAAVVYFRKDIKGFIVSWVPKLSTDDGADSLDSSDGSEQRPVTRSRKDAKKSARTWPLKLREGMESQRRTTIFLIISMFVTGSIGLAFSSHLAAFSSNLLILGIAFIVTAIMLVSSEYTLQKSKQQRSMDKLTPLRAIGIGLIQGFAVIPGISRSGSTIAGGLWMGLSRVQATRYSFLLLIPIVIAGSLRDIVRLGQGTLILPNVWILIVSFVLTAVIGYLTIAWMIKLVSKTSLNWFALYAVLLGIVLIGLYFL